VGVCDAEAGGQSTRVAMFVDGLRTVDFVAPSPGAASGWLAGIDVASQSAASLTVVASHFVLRDTAPLSPVKS
jgi:hypothetical protein